MYTKQVASKLKNADDSLLTADLEGCKEQKSKLDCISRRDALKPFCITSDGTRIPEVDCDNFPVEFSVKDIKRHLLSLPPVTPTERTGEWIYITNPIGEKICVCSECEHIKQQGYREYCGHCGAKMKG